MSAPVSEPLPQRLVCFAHGKESGPWGTKITRLAEVARRRGFEVISPDYSGTHDPDIRVAQLLERRPQARQALVLAGSSMGGYVSAMAVGALQPQALFLMAPAFYFPGFDAEPPPPPRFTAVVHGWQDDIVPMERALRYAQRHGARLHLLDSGHTLNDRLPALTLLFGDLLDRVSADAVYRHAQFLITDAAGDFGFTPASSDAAAGTAIGQRVGGTDGWAIVTAHDPGEQRFSAAVNAARHRQLLEAANAAGLRTLPALGRDPEPPHHSETSLLLIDPPTGAAEGLGRQFEQNAIIRWQRGQAPQVVWLV